MLPAGLWVLGFLVWRLHVISGDEGLLSAAHLCVAGHRALTLCVLWVDGGAFSAAGVEVLGREVEQEGRPRLHRDGFFRKETACQAEGTAGAEVRRVKGPDGASVPSPG